MSPGAAVTATASIPSSGTPASSSAPCTTGTMFSQWRREAISGTTPP